MITHMLRDIYFLSVNLEDFLNPSQGGQYYKMTPMEDVAQARGPTICKAPLYAVPLPPDIVSTEWED